MSNFMDEFKKFILRGNVMDLAVGVIIGGAFQAIINSLVGDIIMPVISMITGGIDFSNWFIQLSGDEKFATLAAAQEAGVATIAYGNFITAVINFLIMAFVIFSIVKTINTLDAKYRPKAPEAPTTKKCPYCQSDIALEAVKCPHCTSDL